MKKEHDVLKQDVARYIENPLNAFSMIKRATIDLSLLMHLFPQQTLHLSRHRIEEFSFVHAVKCLLLLQRIYKLQTRDIARGIVLNRRIGDRMTPHDLYAVGKCASKITNEEYFAKEYLELALERYQNGYDKNFREIDEVKLLILLVNVCESMRDYKSSITYIKEILIKEPTNIKAAEYGMKLVQLFKEHGNAKLSYDDPYNFKSNRDGKYSTRKEFELMSDVCRDKLKRNVAEISRLHCRYSSTNSFTRLARFKLEEVNLEPRIFLIVDALSDDEIQSLKNIAIQESKSRSKVDEKSIYSVVGMASLYDSYELVSRISQRIEVNNMINEKLLLISFLKSETCHVLEHVTRKYPLNLYIDPAGTEIFTRISLNPYWLVS
jgi:Prolyl 4-Hydroxylase alpha-subunit, N-terminal region